MLMLIMKKIYMFYKDDFFGYFLVCDNCFFLLGSANIFTCEHNYDAANENDNDALQRSHRTRHHVIVMLYFSSFWFSVFIFLY